MKNYFKLTFCLFILSALSVNAQEKWNPSKHYAERMQIFNSEPKTIGCSIFLGDSITEGGDWSAFFPNTKNINRGISGDVTKGVIDRLDEVISHKPTEIFLMIGINDIGGNLPIDTIKQHYLQIIQTLKTKLPETKLYVQSTLPTAKIAQMTMVDQLNKMLKKQASKLNYQYINVYKVFYNKKTKLLIQDLSNDGLHPNAKGYQVWRTVLAPYIK